MRECILKRTKLLADELKAAEAAAFIVVNDEDSNWESLYYLSGFRGTAGALLVYADGSSDLILDNRYIEQGRSQSPHEVIPQTSAADMEILSRLKLRGVSGNVLCEAGKTTYKTWQTLKSPLTNLVSGDEILKKLRRKKDAYEVSCIVRAGEIGAKAFLDTLDSVREGMTEKEFESMLNYKINMLGGENGFDMVVASGERSSMPHGRATEKQMVRGEWTTVDFGARYRGYLCDITRNFSIGEPNEKADFRHTALLEAHTKAAQEIKAGADGADLHNTALDVLEKYGLADAMTHSLGHGFGLEIHESPILSRKYSETLIAGDIVTIEPGVYFKGWGGLRLEDDYLVTETGSERLTGKLNQCFYRI